VVQPNQPRGRCKRYVFRKWSAFCKPEWRVCTWVCQATLSFKNFFAALEASDFSKEEVVFVDIAFADLSMVDEVNELFIALFPENRRPARTIYQVAALPFGGKVKVMGTAVKKRAN